MLPRRLGLPVIASQGQFALVFDEASLAVPIVHADMRLFDLLQVYAEGLLAERAHKDDIVGRARRWIFQYLHTGEVAVTQLASGLGMSDRTLGRRLAEEGLTPARLIEQLRRELACNYLTDRAVPLGRITYLLGYSDLSAFTRAFRRWTGRTPSEWRLEQSQPSA
jgi:AraC-like DNA-binding protein